MNRLFIGFALVLSGVAAAQVAAPERISSTYSRPIYADLSRPLEERVEDALSRMSISEKLHIIHAQSKFSSRGVPRLGIPDLWTDDGPHGVRPDVLWDEWEQAGQTNDSCVAFPALTCLAACWDPEIARLYGESLGEEARYRGKSVLLGPGVNIYRTPLNGRNFEYLGEDPFLASEMAISYIQGLQSRGVAACVKHYALNNNEVNRHTTNVVIDDRTLYEIYLPAFKAAVERGGAWSLMGAYNLLGDEHLCHNDRMLNGILKNEWGFDGAVISDWGGCHAPRQAIANGLDLEFGSWTDGLANGVSNAYDNYYLADPYLKLIESGEVSTDELDDKARRVLRLIMRTAMDPSYGYGSLCSEAHYDAARRIGDNGIVLLRNEKNVLPIRSREGGKILVVGENAVKMMTVGGGSSSLKAQREVSPLEGIRKAAEGRGMSVDYARGYVGDVSGEYNGVVTGQDLSDSRTPAQLIAEAVEKARDADYVIFVGGLNKSPGQDCEDADRESLDLPYAQDDVIAALAKANRNLAVVNISGNAVAMPWVKDVPAIVQTWFLGSEAGNSIADILFGDVNPSGKLPFTFPAKLSDSPAHALGAYPGVKRDDSPIVDLEYKEGVLVGYRWHDTRKIRPLFSFGHGLSYTDFRLGKASADRRQIADNDSITFTVNVTNTGRRAGAEVVQLYISDPDCSVERPAKELKAFRKVWLQPGETKSVSLTVGRDALSYFDAERHEWVAEPGDFTAHIGTSSDKISSSVKFNLTR
ncbi:MAG: glycoside hydrolase family 3 C-terminal domain-containing protein [Muribaculaceae bacterium]|nr:glycoside hydrolase family 3 C-terminal domain-containing protein [Muribaculaceae bacterium]